MTNRHFANNYILISACRLVVVRPTVAFMLYNSKSLVLNQTTVNVYQTHNMW